jgi:hypothetical protein
MPPTDAPGGNAAGGHQSVRRLTLEVTWPNE